MLAEPIPMIPMIPMIAFECLSMVVAYASHMLMALAEPRAIKPKLPKNR